MRKAGSMFRQEDVGDDLRLLFQAIAVEGFFRLDLVANNGRTGGA